jgi:hypothetical protein
VATVFEENGWRCERPHNKIKNPLDKGAVPHRRQAVQPSAAPDGAAEEITRTTGEKR